MWASVSNKDGLPITQFMLSSKTTTPKRLKYLKKRFSKWISDNEGQWSLRNEKQARFKSYNGPSFRVVQGSGTERGHQAEPVISMGYRAGSSCLGKPRQLGSREEHCT